MNEATAPKRQVLPSASGILTQLRVIKDAVQDLKTEVAESEVGTSVDLSRAFVVLRILKDNIEETFKEFDAIYANIKDIKIPEKFNLEGVPSINLDEGYRVTVAHNVRASIRTGVKESAYQWLRDNGLGELVTETVNSSTLSAAARAMAEENRELDDQYFNVAIMPTTSVTKTKGKS